MLAPKHLPTILVLTSTLPRWAGDTTPAFVMDLCRQLAGEFDVHVLAPHASGACRYEIVDGVSIHRFRYLPQAWQSLAYDGGIPERLRRQPLALLQVPFFLTAQFFATLRLAWTLRPRMIHAHWILPQAAIAMLVSAISPDRPPVLCTVHGTDLYGLNAGVVRWLKALVLRRMAIVTIVSEAMRAAILAQGVSPVRVHLAPMGVDTKVVFRSSDAGSRENETAVFVGRLVKGKGVDILLRAMARISSAGHRLRLVIVGDGPERQALESLALDLNLGGKIEFSGALPRKEVAAQFRSARVAVFPFTGAEGLGLVVVEAQACGCPVIASDIPAVRDTVVPNVTGLVTPPGDSEALAGALVEVLSNGPRASQMAKAALASVLERFAWPRVSARYREMIISLMA